MIRNRNSRSAVRGAVLVQFALLSFAIMGIMAVALDIGMVRSVQAAMQTGTQAAALEGMRMRNAFECAPLTPPDVCSLQQDFARRLNARRSMALVFDEDLDLSTRNVEFKFGVGGFIDTGIDTTGEVAPTGLAENLDAYNPTDLGTIPFQLNETANSPHGDMVAGDFNPAVANADEDPTYVRPDFANLTPLDGARSNAFLVRMRRGNDPLGLDRIAGESSSGPAVPIVFGLGAMVSGSEGARYDPRRDGFTVRSTSIAEAKPALAAGLRGSGGWLGCVQLGYTPDGRAAILALDASVWAECIPVTNTLGPFPFERLEIKANGRVDKATSLIIDPCPAVTEFGRVLGIDGPTETIVEFGNTVSPAGPWDHTQIPFYVARDIYYVPLYRTFRAGSPGHDPACLVSDDDCWQIVGFGAIRVLNFAPLTGSEPGYVLTLEKLGTMVAKENATALLRSAVASLANADPFVLQAHQALLNSVFLQAPVLVR